MEKETKIKNLKRKSLGQHWLRSEKALAEIVKAGDVHTDDIVLEIGPGQGVLTERLIKLAGKVIAVEKDRELVDFLKEKFKKEIGAGKLNLVEKDILDFDPALEKKYKIIANIPYYITGAILRKFLTANSKPERMVLLVQKEVADRIVAQDGKESLLSVSVKAYGDPKIIARVPRGAFAPPPAVDSAILLIEGISKNLFAREKIEEQMFFRILRAGFARKRKQLAGNLTSLRPKKEVFSFFDSCQIPKNIRAERLNISNWICLTREFTKTTKK